MRLLILQFLEIMMPGKSARSTILRGDSECRRLPFTSGVLLAVLLAVGSCLDQSALARQSVCRDVTPESKLVPLCLKRGVSSIERLNSVTGLTTKEKEIARELGYDEKVLELIKEWLHPEMGILKKGGLEPWDIDIFTPRTPRVGLLLEKDKLNYEKLAAEYPELKDVIRNELERYSAEASSVEAMRESERKVEMGEEKYKRYQRLVAETKTYMPLFMQVVRDDCHRRGVQSILIWDDSIFDSDSKLEEAIASIKNRAAGQTLKPENRGRKYLGLRFSGVNGDRWQSDPRITALRPDLEKLGYRISEELGGIQETKQFDSRLAAEKYLRDSGTSVDTGNLTEQKAKISKVIYPPDPTKADSHSTLPRLRIWPGSIIKKLGENQWLIETPTRYTASAVHRLASVMVCPPEEVGFDMVRSACTIGGGVSNERIIEKLKYWDSKYGVTVIEATGTWVKIRFKDLPEDLSQLCTEIVMFSPVVELTSNVNYSAATMREFARTFRQTKEVLLGWD